MTSVTDLLSRVRKVDVGFESENAIEATKEDIIARQRDQLLHGLGADDKEIGRYKSDAYAKKKHALNPLPGFGVMDWKLTGDLHKAIFVDVRTDIYVIDSADPKTGELIKRIRDPFGLDKKNQTDYVEEKLRPDFMGRIHKATGL